MSESNAYILAVDDDEFCLEVIVEYLEYEDIVIDTTTNGNNVLEILESNPEKYQLIILDLRFLSISAY